MKLATVLDKLLLWTLKNGFSRHSLAEIAKPLSMSRGAFCYYFSAQTGGLKSDIAKQLLLHARNTRARFLVYPLISFHGTLLEKRTFFARQMAHYLYHTCGVAQLEQWHCPVYLLEQELRYFGPWPEDQNYGELLESLFRGPGEYQIMKLNKKHLEKMVSGPFDAHQDAVLDFFNVEFKRAQTTLS